MDFIETIKALSVALETELGVPVIDKDIRKGFERPCLFVEVVKINSDLQCEIEHELQDFTIFYFGKSRDEGYLDLLKKKRVIQKVLQSGLLTDSGSTPDIKTLEWEFDRLDMFLGCKFQIEDSGEFVMDDESEMMDTLEINEGVM